MCRGMCRRAVSIAVARRLQPPIHPHRRRAVWPPAMDTCARGCAAPLTLDLDWKDAEMQCEGGPRPSGNGVRVSIVGPLRGDGQRIRMVFGIAGVGEGASGKALPTNVTILFEGEKRIFATLGDDKCTVDQLTQQRVEMLVAGRAVYRVVARGFCLGPATSLSQTERVVLTRFDFAGRVEFMDDDRKHAKLPANPFPSTAL